VNESLSLADQKLLLEIEDMKRSPWLRPASIAMWIPFVVGLLSLGSDYLDVVGLREKAATLDEEVVSLEQESVVLQDRLARLQADISVAADALTSTRADIGAFVTQTEEYAERFNVVRTEAGADRFAELQRMLDGILGSVAGVQETLAGADTSPAPVIGEQ